MSYGFEVYNEDGNLIIDQNYGTAQPVEPLGFPSTVTWSDYFPEYPSYVGNILSDDVVVARPNRNPSDPNETVYVGGMNGLWGFLSPAMAPYGTNYYRLRRSTTVSAGDYGLVVYEEDGVTPTFDSNNLASVFNIVAKPYALGDYAWYDIPAGESIDDYYVVLPRVTSTAFAAGPSTFISWKGCGVYDFANNRISFLSGFGTTVIASSGTIGKIS